MIELTHKEALRHVMQDEVLDRLDRIADLLEQLVPQTEQEPVTDFQLPTDDAATRRASWRVAGRHRSLRRLRKAVPQRLQENPDYLDKEDE